MFNILVTGANGQLGRELKDLSASYPYTFYFASKDELDINSKIDIQKYIESNQINTIINAAAYTKVDMAQEQKELADAINHIAIKNIAQLCLTYHIRLIHISTDYVFSGTNHRPYTQNDMPDPQSVYGQSKLNGEKAIIESKLQDSIIIRTSWLYSSYGHNFVKTIMRIGKQRAENGESLKVVYDQIGSPTYAYDLAKAILDILPHIKCDNAKIYHYANEGAISWYDFAKEIVKMAKINVSIEPILSEQYPTPAKRPHYCVLDKNQIKSDFKITIPYWKDSLKSCINKLS